MERLKLRIYKLLKRSDSVFKTDMVYIAKGSFWLTLNQIVDSFSAFLLAASFAHFLPKETYGTYKYLLSLAGLVGIITLPGLYTSITQAVARGFEGTLKAGIKEKIRWGFAGTAVSLAASLYYYIHGNTLLAVSFAIIAVFIPFLDTFSMYDTLLSGRKKFNLSAQYTALGQVATVAALIGAIYFTHNLLFIIFIYFASSVLVNLCIYLYISRRYPPNSAVDPSALSYGKHLSLMNVINTIAGYLDKILVFHYLGALELAVYSFATAIPDQIKGVMSLIDRLMFPKYADRSTESIRKEVRHKFFSLFFIGIITIGSYVIAAPYIYKIFFPQYLSAVRYSQIFALSMLNMAFLPASVFLQAKKRIKEQYIIQTVSPIFQIIAMTFLIIWQGLWGLIIARILSRFFSSFMNLYFFYRPLHKESEPPELPSAN